MMRILAAHVYHESNTFCPEETRLEHFEIYQGGKMLALLPGVDVLTQAGAQVIPSIYASRWSSGTVARTAYETFERAVLSALQRAIQQGLDGIYLSLHGSMTVAGLGSGEYQLLRAIRGIAGDEIPIAVAMDMHANLHPGVEKMVNVLTGYHTAPHTDAAETQRKAARGLLRLIVSRTRPHPAVCRLPMLIVGERALSRDEPFRTLFARCRALEQEEGILAATVYVGMAWSDTPWAAASVAISAADAAHVPYARQQAYALARFLLEHREECAYAHPAFPPQEALDRALASGNRPLYLSDSGDNPTAGGVGDGTVLLALAAKAQSSKRLLFAPIVDAAAVCALANKSLGWKGELAIGSDRDVYCRPVSLSVQLLDRQAIYALHGLAREKVANGVLLRSGGMDLIITDRSMAFTGMECFESAGVDPRDYDIVVLKMGYMFDEISDPCRENVMALTLGCTPLQITPSQYHHLQRPIWPLDPDIFWKEENL